MSSRDDRPRWGGRPGPPAGWASSGFKGVYACKRGWRVTVRVAGRPVHVGVFDTIAAAHAAYLGKVKEIKSSTHIESRE